MSPHVEAIADEFTRYKALGEAAIAQLDDDELGLIGSDGGNSIVAIVWHLAGNLESRFTDFRTSDGEKPWRDRDDEFVLRSVTKSALLEKWERGWRALLAAISELTDADLLADRHDPAPAAAYRPGAAAVAGAYRVSHRPDRVSGEADSQRRLAMFEYSARRVGGAQRARGRRISEGARPDAGPGSLDPAAADDDILVVEHDRLPWRHRRLRLVELELGAIGRRARARALPRRDGGGGSARRRGASLPARRPRPSSRPDAVSVVRSSAARGPTVTSPDSASIFSDVQRHARSRCPSPLRWPIVNRCTPSCAPSVAALRRRRSRRRAHRRCRLATNAA